MFSRRKVTKILASSPRSEPPVVEQGPAEDLSDLRAEIVARISKQHDVVNLTIIFVIGTVGLLSGSNSLNLSLTSVAPILLVATASLNVMALDHEMNIAHLTQYIDARLSTNSSTTWSKFRSEQQQGGTNPIPTLLASGKYLILGGVNVALVFITWKWSLVQPAADYPDLVKTAMLLASIFGTLIAVLSIIGSIYTGRLWLRMKNQYG